jgi:CHAD domain-containing protein
MDVLTALIPSLVLPPDDPSLVQLVEYLGAARKKQAQKLRATITTYRKPALRGLKHCASTLDKADEAAWQQSQSNAVSAAHQLAAEAAAAPRLTADSIHRYRIKLKALRYTLQLAEGDTPPFVRAIEKVTDAIGTWHDWIALLEIAKNLFDPTEARPLSKLLRTIQAAKLRQALSSAAALQKKYLNAAVNNRSIGTPKP